MTLASSNLNIDLETRMRRERAGDSEYITEGIYDQLKINEAGGGKLPFLEGGGGWYQTSHRQVSPFFN